MSARDWVLVLAGVALGLRVGWALFDAHLARKAARLARKGGA